MGSKGEIKNLLYCELIVKYLNKIRINFYYLVKSEFFFYQIRTF